MLVTKHFLLSSHCFQNCFFSVFNTSDCVGKGVLLDVLGWNTFECSWPWAVLLHFDLLVCIIMKYSYCNCLCWSIFSKNLLLAAGQYSQMNLLSLTTETSNIFSRKGRWLLSHQSSIPCYDGNHHCSKALPVNTLWLHRMTSDSAHLNMLNTKPVTWHSNKSWVEWPWDQHSCTVRFPTMQ